MGHIFFWCLMFVAIYFIFRKGSYVGEVSLGRVTEFSYSQSFFINYTHIKTEKHVMLISNMRYIDVGDELVYVRHQHRGFIVNKTKKSFKHGVDTINNLNTLKDFQLLQKCSKDKGVI